VLRCMLLPARRPTCPLLTRAVRLQATKREQRDPHALRRSSSGCCCWAAALARYLLILLIDAARARRCVPNYWRRVPEMLRDFFGAAACRR
jgi:hypothetical protein